MVLNDSKDDKSRDRDRTRRTDRPSRFSNISNKDRDRSPMGVGADPRRRIIVSNIPFEYRWQDLKDLFRTEVGDVTYVEILNDETGKPRGSAIVEFQTLDMVRKAVNKMHRFETKGRKLVIKEAAEEKGGGRRNQGGGGGGGDRNDMSNLLQNNSSKFGNTYGLSPQFLESLGINCPLINKVFVANLDYKVDEKKLREVFRLAGKVENVEIAMDKDGKSRGFGTVEFDHPVEAVQSISMLNNQNLFERRITVRMDRVADRPDGPVRLPEGLKSIGMGLGANGAPLQDVARNLPSMNTNPTPTASVSTPAALAAAVTALTQAQQQPPPTQASLSNLGLNLGLGGVGSGLGNDLTSTLTSLAAANQNSSYNNPLSGLGSQSNSLGQSNILSGMAAYNQGMQAPTSSLSSSNVYGNQSGGGGSSDYSRNASNSMYSNNSRYGGANEMDYSSSTGLSNQGYGNPRAGLDSGRSMNQSSSNERDTVVVKNLPPNTTWQELRDKFRNCGDIKFAEIKGKGDIGLIKFDSEWTAKRAIDMMDRTRVDGKIIDVTFF
uniref:Myelin expression factor 2 n=1 Tax=Cacopsylla melanoneura TaxID=428564 RepID=A0A8D8UWS3_9HEMI